MAISPDALDRSRTAAHRSATQVSVDDLVDALTAKLGAQLVAFIVDKDTSTVSRWRNRQATPAEASVRRLRTAYQVFTLLEHAESDPTIRAWFTGMNPQLDDASPAEALADGRHQEVMTAARAFLTGG